MVIHETTQKDLVRGTPPLTALRFRGRPYKIAEAVVDFLLERRYCEPGDLILWAMTYRRKNRPKMNGRIVIELDTQGGVNGVQADSD